MKTKYYNILKIFASLRKIIKGKIMNLIPINYQLNIFGNFENLNPSSDLVTSLLNNLKEYNFLPTLFNEITSNGQLINRLALKTLDNNCIVEFKINIITINFNKVNDKNEHTELSTIINKYINIFIGINEYTSLNAHRLSLVTKYIYEFDGIENIVKYYNLLFKENQFLAEKEIAEWNYRVVTNETIELKETEKLNVISAINKVELFKLEDLITNSPNQVSKNALEFNFDINTHHSKLNDRFHINEILDFYQKSQIFEMEMKKFYKSMFEDKNVEFG